MFARLISEIVCIARQILSFDLQSDIYVINVIYAVFLNTVIRDFKYRYYLFATLYIVVYCLYLEQLEVNAVCVYYKKRNFFYIPLSTMVPSCSIHEGFVPRGLPCCARR